MQIARVASTFVGGSNACRHAHQHDHCTDLIKFLGREHKKQCKNKDQRHTGQFTEKLGHTAAHLPHADHFGKEVVHHAFEKAVGNARNQNGQKKRFIGSILPINICKFVF